jgi:hypothetical protein
MDKTPGQLEQVVEHQEMDSVWFNPIQFDLHAFLEQGKRGCLVAVIQTEKQMAGKRG